MMDRERPLLNKWLVRHIDELISETMPRTEISVLFYLPSPHSHFLLSPHLWLLVDKRIYVEDQRLKKTAASIVFKDKLQKAKFLLWNSERYANSEYRWSGKNKRKVVLSLNEYIRSNSGSNNRVPTSAERHLVKGARRTGKNIAANKSEEICGSVN